MPGSTPTFGTAFIHENNGIKELPVNVIDFDEHFLNVFDIPVVDGTVPKALGEVGPVSVIWSYSSAGKYCPAGNCYHYHLSY